MKKLLCISLMFLLSSGGQLLGQSKAVQKENYIISKKDLKDKVKGGWAGQTIGVTFGWPSEFLYQGTYIQDYETIVWSSDYVNQAMDEFPGLYDDIYVDLTFVDVIERKGVNASADAFGEALAASEFQLWHANQASRYNLQQGIPASEAGHWLNNPHADDIDFQIESDFIGLMSPGMPNIANEISDRVGRLMNSGDGWYGGVFVSNLYANAFVNDDIPTIIKKSLDVIPPQSKFYQCVSDVLLWYQEYPDDWKRTWFELQNKWAEDVGCPFMVFNPLNIDAKLNSAYVVLGLLYGEGDFTKTLEISTRAGQDSDCNPATAAGVLGTMIGYDKIPAYWLDPLKKAEHRKFSFTEYSLNDTYEISYKHALMNIMENDGQILQESVQIVSSTPSRVPFEENFNGHHPHSKANEFVKTGNNIEFNFDGVGFVARGYVHKDEEDMPDAILRAALYVDGEKVEVANFPTNVNNARTDIFWRYQLERGNHNVRIEILDEKPGYKLIPLDYIVYDDRPTNGYTAHENGQ